MELAGTTSTGTWTSRGAGVAKLGPDAKGGAASPAGNNARTYTFRPTITRAGYYSVYAWWPGNDDVNAYAFNTQIDIVAAEAQATATVNQRENGGRWNYLGKFWFAQGTAGTVTVSSRGATNLSGGTGVEVAADGICFVGDFDDDQDGMEDLWEKTYGLNPANAADAGVDSDLDGLTNLQEHAQGTSPLDFFNGTPAFLRKISGDGQFSELNSFAPAPLVIEVAQSAQAGAPLLGNVPVVFTVTTSGGALGETLGTSSTYQSMVVWTGDSTGKGLIYFKQPNYHGVTSTVHVQAGHGTGASNALVFNLHSHWLAGHWKFDDTAATNVVLDASPSIPAKHGTHVGAARVASFDPLGAPGNQMLAFNGTSSLVSVPNNSDFGNGGGAFTIYAWVHLDPTASLDSSSNIYPVLAKGSSAVENEVELALVGGTTAKGIRLRTRKNFSTQLDLTAATDVRAKLRDGNPHLLAAVRDAGGTCRLYLDGEEVGSQANVTGPFFFNNLDLLIGGNSAGQRFKGNIEDVRLLWSPYRLDEIKALYSSDGDVLPDWWERKHFSSFPNPLTQSNGTQDSDGDGVTDLVEFSSSSNPRSTDSDGDGLSDGWELANGTSLSQPTVNVSATVLTSNTVEGSTTPATIRFTKNGTSGEVSFWLSLTDPASIPSLDFALPGADFSIPGRSANWPKGFWIAAGQNYLDVEVEGVLDTLVEPLETVMMYISSVPGGIVGPASVAVLTITDNPPVVGVTTHLPAREHGLQPEAGVFRFQRSGPPDPILVFYSINEVQSTAAKGVDYHDPAIKEVQFPHGVMQVDVPCLPILDDQTGGTESAGETIVLNITASPSLYRIETGKGTATMTIVDAGPVLGTISAAPAGSLNVGTDHVWLSSQDGGTVYYTVDGSAPSAGIPPILGSGAVALNRAATLKARRMATGRTPGPTSTTSFPGKMRATAGAGFSVLLKQDGTVWTWGANDQGQLGLSDAVPRYAPVKISTLTSITHVDAGVAHSLAVRSDGKVYAWGKNASGQLGANPATLPSSTQPVLVSGLPSTIVRVAAGATHSLALDSSGVVWAWGGNAYGQLAVPIASVPTRYTPQSLGTLGSVREIAAGNDHSLAVLANGSVRAWGRNAAGQAGAAPSSTPVVTPVTVIASSAVSVAAGQEHSLALKSDGSVWSWGNQGHIGRWTYSTPAHLPAMVIQEGEVPLGEIIAISAGSGHSFAIHKSGQVWGWGQSDRGQLAFGNRYHRYLAESIYDLSGIGAVSAGAADPFSNHSLALRHDGTLLSFGSNATGQLGDGSLTVNVDRDLPRAVKDADADGIADWWEAENGLNPASSADANLDADGDGYTAAQEFADGTNPTDGGSFVPRTLTITSGNNQESLPNSYLLNALVVTLRNPDNTPAKNIKVTFQGERGYGRFATSKTGTKSRTLTVTTNSTGTASVYYEVPTGTSESEDAPVVASVGTEQIIINTKINYNIGPTAPGDVTSTYLSATQTKISWVDRSNNETGFVIMRSGNLEDWQTVATLPANTVSFTDSVGSSGPSYLYRVHSL